MAGMVAGKVMPRPRGPYDPDTIYQILDMVNYDNKLWMAKTSNLQGAIPSKDDTVNWMLCIDSKGEDLQALEASIDSRFASVGENIVTLTGTIENVQSSMETADTELQTQITSNTNAVTALQNGKANKSTTVTTTIPSSGWGSDGPPYANTLTVEGVTETSIVDIVIPGTTTSDEMAAYQEAMILNGSQAEGQVTLYCWGVVPIIDLPVTIVIRG